MKLFLTVCLTCAVLYRAESLRCHSCTDALCSNTASIECPANSQVCMTGTSVRTIDSVNSVTVYKNCSSLLTCLTSLGVETEWSVNYGFVRDARAQICCITDNCNHQTLDIPSVSTNGKQCPACASAADSLAGTCNTTVSCMGNEDKCFNGTTTLNSVEVLQLGCISRNLCNIQAVINAVFGTDANITCEAPWSIRISGVLLTFALTLHKVLV